MNCRHTEIDSSNFVTVEKLRELEELQGNYDALKLAHDEVVRQHEACVSQLHDVKLSHDQLTCQYDLLWEKCLESKSKHDYALNDSVHVCSKHNGLRLYKSVLYS